MDGLSSGVILVETFEHQLLDRYFLVAGSALFVYDVLINLDVEIRCVWAALDFRDKTIHTTAAVFNLMYLVQRYLPLIDQVILDSYILLGAPNRGACAISYEFTAWCSITGIALSELILALRIWAVWEKKIIIGVILVAFWLGCSIPAMVFFAKFMGGIEFPEFNGPLPAPLQRCLNIMENKQIYLCWILLMVYDTASFALMAIPGFKAFRTGGRSNLMKVVYRDGVVYYAFIFMVSLVNVIIILTLPPDLVIIISPLERVLHSLLASRAILHIREVGSRENMNAKGASGNMITEVNMTTWHSDMTFGSSTFESVVEP